MIVLHRLDEAAPAAATSAPLRTPCVARDLCRPEAYPEPRPLAVELVETHLSWVFLTRDSAFKVKKPVSYSFVDFRRVEARRAACEAEVTLNRRLSSDVYLGVVPVRQSGGGLTLSGDGEIVDWAVHMRRLSDATRGDRLLARGALDARRVDALAERLARFHAEARCDTETAAFGALPTVAGNVAENFRETTQMVGELMSPDEARALERSQLAFLRSQESLLARRMAEGRVRDGHGDLRLEHVYFEEGDPRIIDCIEFSERFRFGDVCADVAFLAMDLVEHGRPDLGELFIARYARSAGDYDLYALVDFYEGYRAHVRAKVASYVANDADASHQLRLEKSAEARRHFILAVASARRSLLPPMVVAVGGVIASGKSTVAEAIAEQMSCPVIDADRTRKHMLGVPETRRLDETAWSGAYDRSVTRRVYEEVMREAGVVLASGRSVVLDASFRSVQMRKDARALAHAHALPFLFVECHAGRATCLARLEERAKGAAVSDGRAAIFDDFCRAFDPVLELTDAEHAVVDTSRPWSTTLEELRPRVPMWPLAPLP
jgi:aminoglycoside phosphotransferase family enzyme/predicted kinase